MRATALFESGGIVRLCNKWLLRTMERQMVGDRYDWEGYNRVLQHFRPIGLNKIYLNQIWSEWKRFMDLLTQRQATQRMLELGTGRAGSTYFLSKLGGERSLLVTIDKDPISKDYVALYRRRRAQDMRCIVGDSHASSTAQAVAALLDGASFDLLYIDGDHTYEGVKRDFELYRAFCSGTSLIALHDICPDHRTSRATPTDVYSGEVYRFWNEIKPEYEHAQLIESPQQDGFGIGVIYYKQGPTYDAGPDN